MSAVEDYEKLKYRVFTSKSEADKAIQSLKGILLGIKMDGKIDSAEINELSKWSRNLLHYINRNPFKEFMSLIQSRIAEGGIEIDDIEDLYWLTQKYENDNIYYDAITTDLQILQGICHGIISNGEIHDQEIHELKAWLKEHQHLISYFPYDELNSLITMVLKDGVIDNEERLLLKAYFNEFAKLSDDNTKSSIEADIKEININGLCTLDPIVSFDSKVFSFTGIAKRAPRSILIEEVTKLGGLFTNSVSNKTHYLVVGDSGNPCWAFACYGRKVERAMSLRKEGHPISLVHEFDFWDFVEDAK